MKPIQKILLFNFFLFCASFFSQNQRFIYDYKFVSDSTQKDKIDTEQMYLDVAEKGSKYYSRDSFVSDSLINAEFDKQAKIQSYNLNFAAIKRGKVQYSVEKMYPNYEILFFNKLDNQDYKVLDSRLITWEILPEKEIIGIWNVQKATTTIYGRHWTAWFATEIPIQDGPYKFHGLPGLIIKIYDQTNTQIMELKGIKNLSDKDEWKSQQKKDRYEPLVNIDEKKYQKVIKIYREDPLKI